MLGKAPDIRRLQNRMDRLAAVGALGAVDFPGYFLIEIMDRRINTPDGETRSLEKAAECPVGFSALLRELLNSLNVGFESHLSENQTLRLTGSWLLGRSGSRLFGSLIFLFRSTQYIHGSMDDSQNVNLI